MAADRTACRLLAMLTAVTLLGLNWNVLLPLLATRDLDGTTGTLAMLMASMSVGFLFGILWLARLTQVATRLLAQSCIAFGAASALLALAPSIAVATLAALFVGASSIVLFNGGVIALQLGTIPVMRDRVMAVFSMTVLGGHAIGSPISGWLAELTSTRIALALGAVASLTVGIAAAATELRITLVRSPCGAAATRAQPG